MDGQEMDRFRQLRDDALEQSHFLGTRRSLGNLSIGTVRARWLAEDESSIVTLTDSGLRLRERNFGHFTTALSIREQPRDGIFNLRKFRVDSNIGEIEYSSDAFIGDTMAEGLTAVVDHFVVPNSATPQERELLFSELERGASGQFTIN